MKPRSSLLVVTILVALAAVMLLLGGAAWLASFSTGPALAASQADEPVWASHAVVEHRTPGGLVARSLVTLPEDKWYFALGGDRVVLASESDPDLYVDRAVLKAEAVQVAVYPDGQAALAYLDRRPGSQVLYVARPALSGHLRESLVSALPADTLESPSLAVDSQGWLHLTYIYQGELLYTYHDGVDWHGPTVAVSQVKDWGSQSLAVDSTDTLHLAYQSEITGTVDYRHSTMTGWSAPVQISSAYAYEPHLLVDGSDRLHLVYAGSSSMEYAVLESGGWLTETIDSAYSSTGFHAGLALDASNNPHVSYIADVCGGCYDLRYAHRDSGGWHPESLLGSGDGVDTTLAVDASGNPYLLYTLRGAHVTALHTAMKTGGGWTFDALAFPYSAPIAGVDAGRNPALAIPSSGEAQAAFQLEMDGDFWLGFAQGPLASLWPAQTLTETMYVDPDILVDAAGGTHIVFGKGNTLYYRHRTHAGVWTEELIATESTSPEAPVLALDPLGSPAVAYRIPSGALSYAIKYAVRGTGGWSTPETLLSNSHCAPPSLLFEDSGKAHLAIGCGREIVHRYQGQSGWESEDYTDYNIELISRLALALDEDNNPHIFLSAYPAESSPEEVELLWKDGTGWHRQPLGPGSLAESAPLQRDPSGNLLLLITTDLYQPSNPENIFQILEFSGSVLTDTTTIREFPEAGEAAFGLDAAGRPYILYYDLYRDDLRLGYLYPPIALAEVTLSSVPAYAAVDTPVELAASVLPLTSTLPLEYLWTATGQPDSTHSGGVTDTITLSWETPGEKQITVTASNTFSQAVDSSSLIVEEPVSGLQASSVQGSRPGLGVSFSAQTAAGSNLEYLWDFGDGQTGSGSVVEHHYDTPGTYTVTLTVDNHVSEVVETLQVTVWGEVFLPLLAGQTSGSH
jgi:hypothetical protein